MASRGRRYDGEPKLNVKKVLAVLIILAVIVMCIVLIIRFATDDSSTETKVVANSYITVFSGDKWGVINSRGETIIQPTYDDMMFSSGYELTPIISPGFISHDGHGIKSQS